MHEDIRIKGLFHKHLDSMPFRVRLLITLTVVISLMGVSCIVAAWTFSRNVIMAYYTDTAERLAGTVAVTLNTWDIRTVKERVMDVYDNADSVALSDEWGTAGFNSYIALFDGIEELPGYIRLREALRRFQDINDVDCIYICVVDPDCEKVIYLVDGAYEGACPPGCVDPLYNVNRELTINPDVGFPPYVSKTGYGWLITAGAPVYDKGVVEAYVMVDVSMTEIKREQLLFVLNLAVVMLAVCLLAVLFGARLIKKYLSEPIRILSDTARSYCKEGADVYHYNFSNISIKNNDEIGGLLRAMQQMERDMNMSIRELTSAKTELEEMTDVAMKDPLTGVGSKAAYEEAVSGLSLQMMDPACHFGIVMVDLNYLKYINDTYGHAMGNKTIIELAKILSEVFARSPVFRIGGDEFVIILKNRDYKQAHELVAELRDIVKGQPDGRPSYDVISAAVGYAEFGEADSKYEDVFNRADTLMYEDKERLHVKRGS